MVPLPRHHVDPAPVPPRVQGEGCLQLVGVLFILVVVAGMADLLGLI